MSQLWEEFNKLKEETEDAAKGASNGSIAQSDSANENALNGLSGPNALNNSILSSEEIGQILLRLNALEVKNKDYGDNSYHERILKEM